MRTSPIFILIMLLVSCSPLGAVEIPAIFSSHMVLQQQAEVPLWGWGRPGETIRVTASWDKKKLSVKTDPNGRWQVMLTTPKAGGPYTIQILGYTGILLENVLIGEVWLVSGQSNMEWSASAGIDGAEGEILQANHPSIRLFTVAHRSADGPQLDLGGEWTASTPESMKKFSAIGYFFARELQQKLGVPIGIISSSWGGTTAETWVHADTIAANPLLAKEAAKAWERPYGPHLPGKAYNAMIAPLIPFRMAGVLWYQGESNIHSPHTYQELLPTLIRSWRKSWGREFPFYFAQIAPYAYGSPYQGVLLRDGQRRSLQVTNTGMVVLSDIGDINNLHPTNKLEVGKRFAHLALNQTYGRKEFPASGPLYRKMKVEGTTIRLHFEHAEGGLVAKGGELSHFEIAGADQQFVPAQAKIEGTTIVVSAKGVPEPVAVRFAWSNTAEPNLFNRHGLPASTFRTDDWEMPKK